MACDRNHNITLTGITEEISRFLQDESQKKWSSFAPAKHHSLKSISTPFRKGFNSLFPLFLANILPP
jgi:hypothetical protein